MDLIRTFLKYRITKCIKSIIKGRKVRAHIAYCICPILLEEICESNHWVFNWSDDRFYGWAGDWYAKILVDDVTISVYGSMYYGYINLYKEWNT